MFPKYNSKVIELAINDCVSKNTMSVNIVMLIEELAESVNALINGNVLNENNKMSKFGEEISDILFNIEVVHRCFNRSDRISTISAFCDGFSNYAFNIYATLLIQDCTKYLRYKKHSEDLWQHMAHVVYYIQLYSRFYNLDDIILHYIKFKSSRYLYRQYGELYKEYFTRDFLKLNGLVDEI